MAAAMAAMDRMDSGGNTAPTSDGGTADAPTTPAAKSPDGADEGNREPSGQVTSEGAAPSANPTAAGGDAPAGEPDEDTLEAIARRAHEKRMERERSKSPEPAKDEHALERELREKLALFERDPIAYLEQQGADVGKTYERFTKMAIDRDKVLAADEAKTAQQRVAELEARIEAFERQQLEQQQQREAQRGHQAARERFAKFSSDSEAFPLLSRLSDAERVEQGVKVARLFVEADEPYDDAKVAGVVERELRRKYYDAWGDLAGGAKGETAKGGGQKSGEGPATITSQLGSESAGVPAVRSERERFRRAKELAERLL